MPAANIYIAQSWRGGEGSGLCLAANLVWRTDVADFEREWAEVLDTVGTTYVRLSALAHGTRNFAGIGLEKRAMLERRLFAIAHKFVRLGVSAFSPAGQHPPADADAYRACLGILVEAIGSAPEAADIESPVGYFMAEDQADQRLVAAALTGPAALPTVLPYGFHSFGRKRRLAPLQAADMLAWLSLQAVPVKSDQPWRFRKDLLGLLRPQDSVHVISSQGLAQRILPI